jgi:hypothetical protein
MKTTGPSHLARAYLDDLTVRGLDADKRQATFVAATENGVLTWGGREYLRMSGVSLKRFRKNPVILDTHERGSAGAVIGKGEVWVDGRELMLTVTFAQTARAEEIWQLVSGGFLRAVSVGFIPGKAQKLADGEEDTENRDGKPDPKSTVKGPGTVIKTWDLYEVSVVPVPADSDAVRRELGEWLKTYGADLTAQESGAGDDAGAANHAEQEIVMKELFEKWAKARKISLEGIDDKKRAELEAQCQRELAATLVESAPPAPQAPAPAAPQPSLTEALRALAPRHLDAKAVDAEILQAKDMEDGRKRLLTLAAQSMLPVGTIEPVAPPAAQPPAPEKTPEQVRSEMEGMLRRGLIG